MAHAKTIGPEQLCTLTGLTDRRHRQLAKDGWFPSPVRGQYQLVPTIQGLFKYYRGLNESTPRAKNVELRNKLLEHSLALRKREVIPVEEVRRTYTRAIVASKAKHLAIPSRLCQKLALMEDPVEIEQVLKEAEIEALRELEVGEWVG